MADGAVRPETRERFLLWATANIVDDARITAHLANEGDVRQAIIQSPGQQVARREYFRKSRAVA